MKILWKLLLAMTVLGSSAFAQYTPPVTVTTEDGTVTIPQIVKIVVSNGSLTVAGKTAHITTAAGGVSSVFGRNGVVTAQAGDYTIDQITIGGTPDGTKFLRDDGTWQPTGGGGIVPPFSVTDNLSDTTPNYTSYRFNVTYNGTVSPATTLVNLGLASRLVYGNLTPATGTQHNITTTADVIGSGSAINEIASLMGWMRFTTPARAWFTDWSLHGAIAQQQEQLNGVTMFVNNYFNGNPANNPSAAFIAVSSEGKGGGGETAWNLAQTYSVNIGFAVAGHAGNPGVATLRRGFDTAFKAGGQASGWMAPTEQSWIGIGFQVDDYDTAGFVLGQPRATGTTGFLVADNVTGGAGTWANIIDFNLVAAADIATGGSIIRLPAVADPKIGIQFGSATRLHVGTNSIAQIAGKLGIGGAMTTAAALLEVIGSASVSDPLVAFGSPGVSDANSMKFYNGTADLTLFMAGGTGQFVPPTLVGDGGLRSLASKKIVFGDPTGGRLVLNASPASPVNYLAITNAATGNRPSINPVGTDSNVGLLSTQQGSGAFIIESGSGLNDVTAAAIRRTGTTRGFDFIPSVSPNSDPHLRLVSGQTWSTSFFNEADGAIASMSINASQSGSRTNATVGGIFRMDTRTGVGGLANGEQAFVVFGVPTGGNSPAVRFVSSLETGDTLVNLNGGTFGVGITAAATQQFNVTSLATTRVAQSLNSAANSSVDLAQWNNNVDDTSTVANLATLDSRSNGTAAAGFGHSITHTLETSTTNARTAATQSVFWATATEGSQISNMTFSTVNAAVLGERLRLSHEGIKPGGVAFAALGTPAAGFIQYCSDCQVASGADNTCANGGSGALAVRLNSVWRCFASQN